MNINIKAMVAKELAKDFEDLGEYPKEVLTEMMLNQDRQGVKVSLNVFKEDVFARVGEGGFDWKDTKEGEEFWARVLIDRDFEPFFKKFEKTKPYPKLMRVWNDTGVEFERVVFMEKQGKFLAWSDANTVEKAKEAVYCTNFKFAEDIEPEVQVKELTMAQIEEIIGAKVKIIK